MKKFLFSIGLLLASVASAQAGVQITEIMYDPSDTQGEWIEVFNDGADPVDLKNWKIFDGVNHLIPTVAVPAGGYAILADNKLNFLARYPDTNVPVIDIVTGMNNDGDTVILRDVPGTDQSTVVYGASAGANKNGKTLQFLNSSYIAAPPSVGGPTTASPGDVPDTPTTGSGGTVQTKESSPYQAWPSDKQILVSAGGDKIAVAGATVYFDGVATSANGRALSNTDYIWTFGDGGSDRGTSVSHTFHYPGRYVVLLDVISGEYIAKDQLFVEVIPPSIDITYVQTKDPQYIELYNSSEYDLDLGGWVLQADGLAGRSFTIPKNTIILSKRKVIFPSELTKIVTPTENIVLRFPNAKTVSAYQPTQKVLTKEITTVPSTGSTSSSVAPVLSITKVSTYNNQELNRPLIDRTLNETDITKDEEAASTSASTSTDKQDNLGVAAVVTAPISSYPWVWLLGLLVFLSLVSLAFYALQRLDLKEREASQGAEDFKIIE